MKKPPVVLFPLGYIFASDKVKTQIPLEVVLDRLGLHARGNWGIVEKNNALANKKALKVNKGLLLSVYVYQEVKFWIMTSEDRSHTKILFPEEY
jgi:hypothetical protein